MTPALECKIPPLVYLFMFASAALLLARYFPFHRFQAPSIIIFGAALAVLGLTASVAAVMQFRRLRTSVSPLYPQRAQALATSGLFSFSRNPMYLGMLLMLAGWVLALGGLSGVIVLVFFIIVMTQFQIQPEERMLLEKFGDEFLLYKNNVRRWL